MAEQAKTTLKHQSCVLFTTNSVYWGVAKTHRLFIMKGFGLARFSISILLRICHYSPAATIWQRSTSFHNPFTVCAHCIYRIFISYKKDKQGFYQMKPLSVHLYITFQNLFSTCHQVKVDQRVCTGKEGLHIFFPNWSMGGYGADEITGYVGVMSYHAGSGTLWHNLNI